ncbi:similar to Saccharomyces cerevisiae YLR148W PEP3 Component of CORVET tethering complex [Maudiozyma saulgeensis]|uniref:Similar to Saccharomyces cerevisiae YLR148W PEP3 Component of CORVET tethering complex n=1 Tax=Maudiozyma saulgeensis TaxID=1789683 RepID=A0A1X7R5G6_9SACH|nr:similar to Saccharomyces cerevisiae YLR148W PEP3 Component of CORVET tethering complex [Kazachstania saulgeensis]
MDVHIEHVQLESIKGINKNICSLQVDSNSFVFALKDGNVHYIDLDKPSTINSIKIPLIENNQANNEKLIASWLNTDGTKVLTKTNFGIYYVVDLKELQINPDNKRKCIYVIKKLPKRECDIRYVQWLDTNKLLCGTANGKIISIDFTSGLKNPIIDNCWTSNRNKPIQGLVYSPKSGNLLIALKNRLLLWKSDIGCRDSPIELLKKEPKENEDFKYLNQPTRQTHGDTRTRFTSLNNSIFAWATSSAIVYGDISMNRTPNESILNSAKILFNNEILQNNVENYEMNDIIIKDIVLTNYHIIILRDSTLTMVNQLDNKIAYQESIQSPADNQSSTNEQFIGLTVDNYNEAEGLTFWCYSNTNIYEIIVNNEPLSVWDLLCEQKSFDEALALPGLNDWIRSLINLRKGNFLFKDEKDIVNAAKYFGQSDSATIGEIALKYMAYDKDNNKDTATNALQEYLIMKMSQLNQPNNENANKVPRTLLSSWIIWNFMKQLNGLDEKISLNVQIDEQLLIAKRNDLQESFNNFLTKNVTALDIPTVYQIITNQNRTHDLLFFANLIDDYEYMISYWVKHENWYESLKILLKYQNPPTVYKYSTILLVSSPDATINAWMKIKQLNPVNLLPAILTFFTNFQKNLAITGHERSPKKNYALTYLLNYIDDRISTNSSVPPILYNTTLYIMLATNNVVTSSTAMENQKIIGFLKTYEGNYDINFILQISMKFRCHEVAMYLLSELKLYEEAVSIGIKYGIIEEAKTIISKIDLTEDAELDQEKLKKRLWLKIASHMLSNISSDSLDIKQIIKSLLLESNNILEIKDLLMLCEKTTTIANLKDELIKSLENHNENMNIISKDIKRSILLKERIKDEIQNFDKKYNIIEPGESCNYCDKFLQSRKFIIFPCNHCYHKDCIMKLILNSTDYNLINEIQKLTRTIKNDHLDQDTEAKLEMLLTTKCYLCSDMNINTIDNSFTVDETEMNKWNI